MAWPNPSADRSILFLHAVSLGLVPGYSAVVIAAHNTDVDSAAEEDIWFQGGTLSYLTSAETMSIVSDDLNDDNGNTGLWTGVILGLDDNLDEVQEVFTMDGLTPYVTTQAFLRVHKMVGLTAGSSGWNEGTITATATTAGTVQCAMEPDHGVSENSHYTIPARRTGLIVRVELNAAKLSGGQLPVIDFDGRARANATNGVWVQAFNRKLDTAVSDNLVVEQRVGPALAAGTDLRVTARTDQDDTEVRSRMYLLLRHLA